MGSSQYIYSASLVPLILSHYVPAVFEEDQAIGQTRGRICY